MPVPKETTPPKAKARAQAITANERLELSQLNPQAIQRGLMGDDLDLQKMVVYLKSRIIFDSTDRIIDIGVERSIDSASTVTITLNDYDRSILRSGALNARLDIQLDGLWFRLVKVSKDAGSDVLTLVFEQREIAVLRSYPKLTSPGHKNRNDNEVLANDGVKFAHRSKVTRAQFILNLIREVKEFDIPVVIPHLREVQPIEKKSDVGINWNLPAGDAGSGILADYNTETSKKGQTYGEAVTEKVFGTKQKKYLTAKNVKLDKEQINNCNAILSTGVSMKARRKVLVASIMTAIDESVLHNLPDGDRDSVGLFQQRDSWGSFSDRHDPATAAKLFFNQAIKYDKDYPNASYNDLCQGVQRSGTPLAYGQYFQEATRIVAAFGIPATKADTYEIGGTVYGPPAPRAKNADEEGSAADAKDMGDISLSGTEDYVYYRGKPKESGKVWEREDNWACITRLAEEVGWRAFFIGGVFYYLTDEDLYKTQPALTITESSQGVMGIGFDYDVGKKGATVDVPCQCGLWSAPP